MNRRKERRPVYVCQECGHESARWFGFCPAPACGSSSPLTETQPSPARPSQQLWLGNSAEPLQELSRLDPQDQARIPLDSTELNRVLGGGIVPGSVTLLVGEPGVGKSTLLLQVAQDIASRTQTVLYVSGEESPHQIKLRSQRLGFEGQGIFLLSETNIDHILHTLEETPPSLAIVDSIQTLYTDDAPSGPGSVVQVRESALRLMRGAKSRNVPVIIAGHMTKDGSLAGPRVLEHMVDVVMYLEGEDLNTFRVLRNGKNRFGSTTEVGIFEMTGLGLEDVPDPSKVLLAQRYEHAIGASLVPMLEGTRPLMIEVQALTSYSYSPSPRRVANGVDYNRLLMLTAVASRRAGLDFSRQDVIVNVAGGFRVSEPAADLGIVLAMGSSLYNRPLDSGTVALGEVGLSGELRSVPQIERRLSEASRLGLTRCILPKTARNESTLSVNMNLVYVQTVRQALQATFDNVKGSRESSTADDHSGCQN